MTITAKRIRVSITREDLTTLISDVFAHEVPVLLVAFGQGNVADTGKELPDGELEEGIDGEYARMIRKYRRPDTDSSPAVRAFPSALELARALGVEYQPHTGLAPTLQESVQYDGAAEEDAPKPKRGRPAKAVAEAE